MPRESTTPRRGSYIQTFYQEIRILLLGFSQVSPLQSPLLGVLILAGPFCNSWQLALLALLGCLVSRAATSLWRDMKPEIADGLYGFNGTLVGIVIGAYWEISWPSLLPLMTGTALSTWLAQAFHRHTQLPGLTTPFTIAVWVLLLMSLLALQGVGLIDSVTKLEGGQLLWGTLGVAFGDSVGQVMFQMNAPVGLLFLLVIAWEPHRKALYALLGALVPVLVVPFVSKAVWREGLLGYNAVLCAVCWAGSGGRRPPYTLLSVVLSVLLELLALYTGLIPLTAPFVLSVWGVV